MPTVRRSGFPQLLRQLVKALPSQCAFCHAWPGPRVCNACTARWAAPVARCQCCALPVFGDAERCGQCTLHPPAMDAALASVDYAYPWHEAIAAFKFRGDLGWAGPLGQLMLSAPGVAAALAMADLVVPIPLSHERLRERGYNQCSVLARHVARPGSVVPLLLRLHDGPAQSALDRAQRLRNLQGAFAMDPLQAGKARGKRAVVIDDVMTTGATLHAACTELRRAGATHITTLVIARTSKD